MKFRNWLSDDDFFGSLTEVEDYASKGYRKITAKHGQYQGQPIWWHPTTKHVVPVNQTEQPPSGQPSVRPAQPMPPQQPVRQWVLAKAIKLQNTAAGAPVVLSKSSKGWEYRDRRGATGLIPADKVATLVQSLRDTNGNPITGPDPDALLASFGNSPSPTEINKPPAADISKTPPNNPEDSPPDTNSHYGGSRPSPEDVRIPEHKMTVYNKKIDQKFANTDSNIMIDALAGTGKTTMLKHLSSFIKPGEKWLYLVFGKKNQLESQNEFPKGVDVLTTHAFLGRLLKANGKDVGGETQLPPEGQKWKKIYQVADQLIPTDWPESYHTYRNKKGEMVSPFHWKGKRLASKIAELSKAYAFDPRDPQCADKINELIQKHSIDTDLSTETKLQDRDYTPDIIEMVIELLKITMPNSMPKYMDQQFAGYRDQDDTLWFTALNADKMRWDLGYDVVLMDEVQDFNACQLIMANKLKEAGARVVGVGDPNQCHPAGTMISMTGGVRKPIEELRIGEEVVTYNSKKSYFPGTKNQGRKVLGIAKRPYIGEMITIQSDSATQRCTPNHRCLVRLDNTKNLYCLYLMVKENVGRLGVCRMNYRHGLGPAIRAKCEKADKSWLLQIFETKEDAMIAETVTGANFGLPQTVFRNTGDCSPSVRFIEEVYKQIGSNMDKVASCLSHFGRDIEYPLWSKEKQIRHDDLKQNYISFKKSFVTQACNLIDGMSVRVFDDDPRSGTWEKIKVSREWFAGDVYSLKVEKTEGGRRLYVADNIVTHNSMYLFRGADAEAFEKLKGIVGQGESESLPINFRSGGNLINWVTQNTHVKDLKSAPHLEGKGEVYAHGGTHPPVKYDDFIQQLTGEWNKGGMLPKSTAMISRTNAPLASAALHFLKNNIDFQIIGKDLSRDLVELIKKSTWQKPERHHIDDYAGVISSYVGDLEEKWGNKISKAQELEDMKSYMDVMLAVLEFLREKDYRETENGPQMNTAKDFASYLQKKLGGVDPDNAQEMARLDKKDPRSYITLITAHKSKGLEWERIFVMKPDEFDPEGPKIKNDEQARQEMNSWYVAVTRGRDTLMVSADDAP